MMPLENSSQVMTILKVLIRIANAASDKRWNQRVSNAVDPFGLFSTSLPRWILPLLLF